MSQPEDGVGPDEELLGSVQVDTASLLLVDPGHLPADVVARLLTPGADGRTPGIVLGLVGDGMYDVVSFPGGIEVADPYGAHGYPHEAISLKQWTDLRASEQDAG